MQKILVIEDDPETCELYLECLEAEGFAAISAENGDIGISKACEILPDLIVCDIMMPHTDGYTVLQALRQLPATAQVPFIFLTAKSTSFDRRHGMELGADGYLSKPCTVEQFLSAIATRFKQHSGESVCHVSPSSLCAAKCHSKHEFPTAFPECTQLANVFQYIEANYHRAITLTDIAQAVGYSPAYLTDLVRRQTGQTVHAWLVTRRMQAARLLLMETQLSVNEIARTTGYSSECNFFRQFRQIHGMSPKVWRQDQIRSGMVNTATLSSSNPVVLTH